VRNDYNGGGGQRNYNNGRPCVRCQLCGKNGHEVLKCWERFNRDYNGEEKVAGSASTSYGVDPNWYIDSGTTDHITRDLEKLSMRERYNGHDQVHTASGAGMHISHIGHSNYHTPLRNFCLKNILHIPKASKI
jgi:hypothetical protein